MPRAEGQTEYQYAAEQAALVGYREYMANLTQSGSSAPSASILHSSLSNGVTWTRGAANVFSGSLTGAFPAGKLVSIPTVFASGSIQSLLWVTRESDDVVLLNATVISGAAVTGSILDNMLVSGAVVNFKVQLT